MFMRMSPIFIIFYASAMADTQLCCALDPPRQALCLRMAYRVPYPNLLLIFLSFSYPS